MREVLCIRGAPGVGKSSAAHLLAKQTGGSLVEVDQLRAMVVRVDWASQAEHVRALEVAADLVASLLRQQFGPVLVVDTFSRGKLRGFLAALTSAGVQDEAVGYASLWADSGELRRRIDGRPTDQFRDADVSLALNEASTRSEAVGEAIIDTTRLTPAETAASMLHHFRPAVR